MSDASAQFQADFDVSRETLERLGVLETLLKKWNKAINLVSVATLSEVWTRHFADSAQILALAPDNTLHWADLGSGAGFPGLVIAILAKEKQPDLAVTLVESDHRKSAFLLAVIRELGLKARVKAERIEETESLDCDVLSARALAPLSKLLEFSGRHLTDRGVALFPKGARWEEEVASARENWSFDLQVLPSQSNPSGVILKISGAKRV
ncbi:16S rRNA (guanine(527)-N(7))-methyltransferase RsmG [Thioclava sp.]|uniref:16S rRNA (guanine(527)-N(7))-methyltransferase RsmG n=1 Tax=Thioclava sp. TaxID=1933450 RepID=UPI003AA861A1